MVAASQDPPRRETPEEARESTKRANLILRRGTARVLWHGATRPDRRFATPETWKAILAEGAEHLQPGPLERDSPIVQLLAGRDRASAYAVQYLWQEPLEAEPADVVFKLDLRLQMVQQA